MIPPRVKSTLEVDILYGGNRPEYRAGRFTCPECGLRTQVMHLVPVVNTPRLMRLCTQCYNMFVDLVTPDREKGSWVPGDVLVNGESVLGYVIKKVKTCLRNSRRKR